MNVQNILNRALEFKELSLEESLYLWYYAALPELMDAAHQVRLKLHPEPLVTWIIDRNINITNVCISGCKFCNFHCKPGEEEAYITNNEEYKTKIKELYALGGYQILLQGGLHPKLGLDYYTALFRELKSSFPGLKLHALGPPEIVHLSRLSKLPYRKVLEQLVEAGLDSLPGAGAEILSDRVRKVISPGKCNTQSWLEVMREAHKMDIITSATMMMGHIETIEERFNHLLLLRQVQNEKPDNSFGFISFIPWPFQDKDTSLNTISGISNSVSGTEYLKFIALSRLVLPNIPNIQPSWLTVGFPIGQMCLHAGANDFGSIMIEEHVVSSAGANYRTNARGIQKAIQDAGFTPRLRNQKYELID